MIIHFKFYSISQKFVLINSLMVSKDATSLVKSDL